MLGLFGKRAVDLAVLFLALYAFAFVPLGKRTGLEHARAILQTRPAKDAGHEIWKAADRLRAKLLGSDPPAPVPATPTVPGPLPATPSRISPVVPKLPRGRAPATALLAPRDPDAPDASL